MNVLLPIRTVSEANIREHWTRKGRRARDQRFVARILIEKAGAKLVPPLVVTLTRIASRRLDDDNLARALKAVRDGVADALKIDDGDPRLTWRYAQEKGRSKEQAVRVVIEEGVP